MGLAAKYPSLTTLDAASLAALETIEIGATSLAALETIELGATTLAALETITADTELPAARLYADNLAYPTAPDVLAWLIADDGATGDKVRVDSGALRASLYVGGNSALYGNPATDNVGAVSAGNVLRVVSHPYLYNPTADVYERQRNNIEGTALASAARTTTTNSADLTNYNGQIVHVQINVTVWTADNLTPSIQAKDALSGTYYTLLTGAAITGTGFTCLKIGPGITAAANVSAADLLPRTWRVVMTHAGATTTTYSVGYSLG